MVIIMKNILQYYYEIIISPNKINDNGYFSYNNHLFCLYEYKRNTSEIEALNYLNKSMLSSGIYINKIIENVFHEPLTIHDKKNYILILINYEYKTDEKIKFIPVFSTQKLDILKRNNWGMLWSMKIDYIEYQLKHIKNSYPLINDSVNYYIGMAENAISYFNMLNLANIPLYIEHRRVNINNIYNPSELVIDYKVRDIAEYIKNNFINRKMSIYDIKNYINSLVLSNMDYILLYVRMLYPSFYFDMYEEIVNDNKKEIEINRITSIVNDYEELLYEIYLIIRKKVNILGIDWINRKYM